MIEDGEWRKLWSGVKELSELFPDGLVFIGGIAVLLHVRSSTLPKGFIELSHDGDFYVSLSDFADLRDLWEITANRRLNKHQIIRDGVEFDVYLERNNSLSVKYEDVVAASQVVDGVRVASLEHLLLLKLDAHASRRGSAKGSKDERDLIKICLLLADAKLRTESLNKYLTPEAIALLETLKKSPEFLVVCDGNAHQARDVRSRVVGLIERVSKAYEKAGK